MATTDYATFILQQLYLKGFYTIGKMPVNASTLYKNQDILRV